MTMNRDRNVWAGLAAGVAGGLAASWVMGQYRNLWYKVASKNGGQSSGQENQESQGEDPTVKTASAVSKAVAGREIPEHRKAAAEVAVHYAFGALVGAPTG
jgi:putative membrane protein